MVIECVGESAAAKSRALNSLAAAYAERPLQRSTADSKLSPNNNKANQKKSASSSSPSSTANSASSASEAKEMDLSLPVLVTTSHTLAPSAWSSATTKGLERWAGNIVGLACIGIISTQPPAIVEAVRFVGSTSNRGGSRGEGLYCHVAV